MVPRTNKKFEMVRLTLLSAILFVVAVDAYAPAGRGAVALSTRRRTVSPVAGPLSFLDKVSLLLCLRVHGLWYAACASADIAVSLITQEKASSNKVARTSGFRNPFVLPERPPKTWLEENFALVVAFGGVSTIMLILNLAIFGLLK